MEVYLMNAHTKLHLAKLQEWSRLFSDQKASGLCARQWCRDNHISYHAFNYWKRQLKESVVDEVLPDIVPLSLSLPQVASHPGASLTIDSAFRANCTDRAAGSTVNLTVNGLDLQLDSDVPDEFLAKLMKAVRYA